MSQQPGTKRQKSCGEDAAAANHTDHGGPPASSNAMDLLKGTFGLGTSSLSGGSRAPFPPGLVPTLPASAARSTSDDLEVSSLAGSAAHALEQPPGERLYTEDGLQDIREGARSAGSVCGERRQGCEAERQSRATTNAWQEPGAPAACTAAPGAGAGGVGGRHPFDIDDPPGLPSLGDIEGEFAGSDGPIGHDLSRSRAAKRDRQDDAPSLSSSQASPGITVATVGCQGALVVSWVREHDSFKRLLLQ